MIQLYSNGVTVLSETAIPLENIALKKGCSVTNSGTRTLLFNKAGTYKIDVTASANSVTATTGEITIQLAKNGVLQPGALSEETVASTTAIHALAFSALVVVPEDNSCKCCKSPTIVTIVNEGVDATFSNINVVVTKIC